MQPSVIIIPQPAHHGSHGGNLPTSYVIAYAAIGLLVWAIATVLIARHDPDVDGSTDGYLIAIAGGATAGLGWPLVLLAIPIWCLAKAASRKAKTHD